MGSIFFKNFFINFFKFKVVKNLLNINDIYDYDEINDQIIKKPENP